MEQGNRPAQAAASSEEINKQLLARLLDTLIEEQKLIEKADEK